MTITEDRPFIEGYYICLKIEDQQEVFVTTTLFDSERKAEQWRQRYQRHFRLHNLYLKPRTVDLMR